LFIDNYGYKQHRLQLVKLKRAEKVSIIIVEMNFTLQNWLFWFSTEEFESVPSDGGIR